MVIKSVRGMVGNFSSLMTSEVVYRATTFILYAMVARYMGPYEFGQLSLALTLFVISSVLAGAGLKTLITREVSRDRTKTGRYLINGSAVVVVCSIISIVVLVFFVRLLSYSSETASIILLLSLGVLPFSLSVICKAVFQAWERMNYIAWANVPVNIIRVGVAYLLLKQGYGLMGLTLLLLASYVTILGAEWWLILQHITKPRLNIDRDFSIIMIRSTRPFLGITAIVAINTNLDILLLSRFTTETQVGLYNAAVQLITPLIVIYDTIMLSVFPQMCMRFAVGKEGLRRISNHLLELLLSIALPAVVGLFFLAEPVLLLLYGDKDFMMASQVLRILAWTLILWACIHVFGRSLLAGLREKVALRIVVTTTVVKLLLGLLLISRFGLIGAAATALFTSIIDFFLHYISVTRSLFQMPLARLAWKPVMASMCMAAYLALVTGHNLFLTLVSAGAVYAISLLLFVIWSSGGPRQFRTKYEYLLSR